MKEYKLPNLLNALKEKEYNFTLQLLAVSVIFTLKL